MLESKKLITQQALKDYIKKEATSKNGADVGDSWIEVRGIEIREKVSIEYDEILDREIFEFPFVHFRVAFIDCAFPGGIEMRCLNDEVDIATSQISFVGCHSPDVSVDGEVGNVAVAHCNFGRAYFSLNSQSILVFMRGTRIEDLEVVGSSENAIFLSFGGCTVRRLSVLAFDGMTSVEFVMLDAQCSLQTTSEREVPPTVSFRDFSLSVTERIFTDSPSVCRLFQMLCPGVSIAYSGPWDQL